MFDGALSLRWISSCVDLGVCLLVGLIVDCGLCFVIFTIFAEFWAGSHCILGWFCVSILGFRVYLAVFCLRIGGLD